MRIRASLPGFFGFFAGCLLLSVSAGAGTTALPSPLKMLWVDLVTSASSPDSNQSVADLLAKAEDAGFNVVVPQVPDAHGDRSDALGVLTMEAHRRRMLVLPAMGMFDTPEDMRTTSAEPGKWETVLIDNTSSNPQALVSCSETSNCVPLRSNPAHREVREHCIGSIERLLQETEVDGVILTHVDFHGSTADLSDATRLDFEKATKVKVTDWPRDVLWNDAPDGKIRERGVHSVKWITWRAGIIRDFVKQARKTVSSRGKRLGILSETSHSLTWQTGGNWADPGLPLPAELSFLPQQYRSTGYGDMLDILSVHLHSTAIRTPQGLAEPHTLEGAAILSQRRLGRRVAFAPAIRSTDYLREEDFEEAVRASIESTGGVLVFSNTRLDTEKRWAVVRMALEARWHLPE